MPIMRYALASENRSDLSTLQSPRCRSGLRGRGDGPEVVRLSTPGNAHLHLIGGIAAAPAATHASTRQRLKGEKEERHQK